MHPVIMQIAILSDLVQTVLIRTHSVSHYLADIAFSRNVFHVCYLSGNVYQFIQKWVLHQWNVSTFNMNYLPKVSTQAQAVSRAEYQFFSTYLNSWYETVTIERLCYRNIIYCSLDPETNLGLFCHSYLHQGIF